MVQITILRYIERVKFLSYVIFSSIYANEVTKMNCVSRIDDKDKNLFVEENNKKGQRWNLYSQIAIENDTLRCSNEVYALKELCNSRAGSHLCTLLDTNEVVDIGYGSYGSK